MGEMYGPRQRASLRNKRQKGNSTSKGDAHLMTSNIRGIERGKVGEIETHGTWREEINVYSFSPLIKPFRSLPFLYPIILPRHFPRPTTKRHAHANRNAAEIQNALSLWYFHTSPMSLTTCLALRSWPPISARKLISN